MSSAHTGSTSASNCIDLVNKYDGRRLLLGLLKQVTDTAGTHAHIHFHKVGAGNGEELHPCLSGGGSGKQRFAGTRRANQQ